MIYMPYLLSQWAEEHCLQRAHDIFPRDGIVIPIIEPMTHSWFKSSKGIAAWTRAGRTALLIVNPYQKEFARRPGVVSYSAIRESGLLKTTHIDGDTLIPTLLIHAGTTLESVKMVLAKQAVRAVVHRSPLDPVSLSALLSDCHILFHVFDVDTTNDAYRAQFAGQAKTILLQNAFVKAPKNLLYSEAASCLHHLPFRCKAAKADGISDLLIETGHRVDTRGGSPTICAMHIGFTLDAKLEVWMQHFVGSSTTSADKPPEATLLAVEGAEADDRDDRMRYGDSFLLAAEKLRLLKLENPNIWLDSHGVALLLSALSRNKELIPRDVKEYSFLHYLEVMHRLCAVRVDVR